MRTICHIYESENQNFGDVIIGKCMDKLMRKYLLSSNIITIPATIGYETKDFKYNTEEIIRIANEFDLVIIGGGGIIDFIFSVIPLDKINKPYICYALGDNSLTKQFFGSFRAEWEYKHIKTITPTYQIFPKMTDEDVAKYKYEINQFIDKADFFSVRSDGSKKFMDIGRDFVESSDPATWVGKFFSDLPRPIEEKYVLINIAGYNMQKRYGITDAQVGEIINEVCDYLIDRGYKPAFINHRKNDYFPNRNDVIVVDWDEMIRIPLKGLAWYEYAEFVIGTRGHSQIIPLGYGVPLINIATQAKNIGFMAKHSLENCMLDSSKLSTKNLIKIIDYVIVNRDALSDKIRADLTTMWQITENQWETINHKVSPKVIKIAYCIEFDPIGTQWQKAIEKYSEWQFTKKVTFKDLMILPSYYEVSESTLKLYPKDNSYWDNLRDADLVFCYTTPFNLAWKWYMLPTIVKSMMKPEAKMIVQFDTDLRWVFDDSWRLCFWKNTPHDEVKDIKNPQEFFEETGILNAGDAYFTVIEAPPFASYTKKPVIYVPLPQSLRVEINLNINTFKPDHRRKFGITLNHSPEKSSAEHTIRNVFAPINMPTLYFSNNRIKNQMEGFQKICDLGIPINSEVINWLSFGKSFLTCLNRGFVAVDDNENYGGWSRFCTECIIAQVPVIGSTLAVKEFFPELYTEPKDYVKQIKLIRRLQSDKIFYRRIIENGKGLFKIKLDPITLIKKMLETGIDLGCSYTVLNHEIIQIQRLKKMQPKKREEIKKVEEPKKEPIKTGITLKEASKKEEVKKEEPKVIKQPKPQPLKEQPKVEQPKKEEPKKEPVIILPNPYQPRQGPHP